MNLDFDKIPRLKEVSVFLLLVVTAILRYPLTPHEMGVDSFLVHAMTNTIVNNHSIPWMVDPLAASGLFAGTYQTGPSVFLAMVVQLCNIDTEHAILFACFGFSILGTLAAYFMANRLTHNFSMSILTALLFSISPNFVRFTLWTYSTRGLFLAMLPLIIGTIIWFLVKFNTTHKKTDLIKIFLVFSFFILIISTIHKMFLILLVIIPISLIIVVFESSVLRNFSYYRAFKDNPYLFLGIILCTSILFFHISFTGISFLGNIWYNFQTSFLFSGDSYPILILNFVINYSRKLSLVFYLGIIGFFVFTYYFKYNAAFIFIVSSILLLLPIIPMTQYTPFLVAPFLSLFASIFLIKMVDYSESKLCLSDVYYSPLKNYRINDITNRFLLFFDSMIKNKITTYFIILLVVLLLLTEANSIFAAQDSRDGRSPFMTDESYSTAVALERSGVKLFNGGITAEIYAISGVPFENPDYLYANMFGIFDFKDIKTKITILDAQTTSVGSLVKFSNTVKIPIQNAEMELILKNANGDHSGNVWYNNGMYRIANNIP